MYSTKKHPGKFEACESQKVAQVLYDVVGNGFTDDEYGECDGPYGWNGLVLGKRYGFLLTEDNRGFFTYEIDTKDKAKGRFARFVEVAEAVECEMGTFRED